MGDTGALELSGYFRYDSGDGYRVWRFTRDVPELRLEGAWLTDVVGPAHAIAGDELCEDREARGSVFRLRRDELVVGRPEWWQVGDLLFGGVWPRWERTPIAAEEEEGSGEPQKRHSRHPAAPEWAPDRAEVALVGVPGTRIRAGDVVVRAHILTSGIPTGCIAIPLTREELEVMRTAHYASYTSGGADGLRSWLRPIVREPIADSFSAAVLRDRRRWVGLRMGRAPLVILRRVAPGPIAVSVDASSDDAAIFVLLGEVGCRMPKPARRRK